MIPIIDNLIQSTIDLYKSAITNLAPTPAKSHYLFNLRDISKIINGILMFRRESFTHRKVFIRYVLLKMRELKNNSYMYILDCGCMKYSEYFMIALLMIKIENVYSMKFV